MAPRNHQIMGRRPAEEKAATCGGLSTIPHQRISDARAGAEKTETETEVHKWSSRCVQATPCRRPKKKGATSGEFSGVSHQRVSDPRVRSVKRTSPAQATHASDTGPTPAGISYAALRRHPMMPSAARASAFASILNRLNGRQKMGQTLPAALPTAERRGSNPR